MKKLTFLILTVAIIIASCGQKKTEDKPIVDTNITLVDTLVVDSMVVDTTK